MYGFNIFERVRMPKFLLHFPKPVAYTSLLSPLISDLSDQSRLEECNYSCSRQGLVPGPAADTKTHGCSSPTVSPLVYAVLHLQIQPTTDHVVLYLLKKICL